MPVCHFADCFSTSYQLIEACDLSSCACKNRDVIIQSVFVTFFLPFFFFFLLGCHISNCPDCVSLDSDITATPNLLEARGKGRRIRLSRETGWISGPLQNPLLLLPSLFHSLSLTFHSVPWKIYCNLADQRRASQSYSPNPV